MIKGINLYNMSKYSSYIYADRKVRSCMIQGYTLTTFPNITQHIYAQPEKQAKEFCTGITKHLSGLESLLNKDKTSPLIAVILPKMDFQYEWEYVIHKLHKSESSNRISISYDINQRKQITFCPYCGVMN